MTKKEMYLRWLNDAYAMEEGIATSLSKQADALEDEPEARMMVQDHLEQTRIQSDKVKECIERQGGDVSSVKSASSKVAGWLDNVMMGMMHDKLVKIAIADHAIEHLEMAAYRALMTAAEEMGDSETKEVCQEILREEEAMAEKLLHKIPQVTKQVLDMHEE